MITRGCSQYRLSFQIGLVIGLFLVSACASTAQPDNECVKGDCQNGKGTMLWNDGAVYAGEWIAGKMHGSGVMRYSDGTKYTGQWYQGMMHGKGEVTYTDGRKHLGVWEQNQFVKSLRLREAPISDISPCAGDTCAEPKKSDVAAPPDVASTTGKKPPAIPLKPVSLFRSSKTPQPAERPFDIRSPTVSLLSPSSHQKMVETDDEWIVIKGEAKDDSGIYKVTINGDKMDSLEKGRFESKVPLDVGLNHIELMVIDNSFNSTEILIKVNRLPRSSVTKPLSDVR